MSSSSNTIPLRQDLGITTLNRRFTRLERKYLERIRKGPRQIVRNASPEAIHDLRVATRRLQSLLDVAVLRRENKSAAKLRKRLKRLRRVVGEKRDIDVIIGRIRRRIRDTSSKRRRSLWLAVHRFMTSEGERAAKQVRREMKRTRVDRLETKIKGVIRDQLHKAPPWSVLGQGLNETKHKWDFAIGVAERSGPQAYHPVRIKTKSLRYFLELVSQLFKADGFAEIIEWLKGMQDELGEWHDDVEFCRWITMILSKDATVQADHTATALIEALRGRTEADTEYTGKLIRSMDSRRGNLLTLSDHRNGKESNDKSRKRRVEAKTQSHE
jgi:CHAD domain-containing protein